MIYILGRKCTCSLTFYANAASVKLRSQSHGGWKQHRVTIAWGRCATTGQPSRRREGPAPLQGKRATNDVAWRRRRDWAVVVAIVVVKNN